MLVGFTLTTREERRHCFGNVLRRARLGRTTLTVCLGLSLLSGSGCARRAYTDVYVQNMASEIRDLEDQLYEFDSEYRVLEQELDVLQAENARLRSALPGAGSTAQPRGNAPQDGSSSRQQLSPLPKADTGTPLNSAAPYSGRDSAQQNSAPSEPNNTLPSPAPSLDIKPPTGISGAPQNSSELPTPRSLPGAGSSEPFNSQELTPPTIEHGEPMPPASLPPQTNGSGPLTSNTPDDLELELGQIKLPAQFASANVESRYDVESEMPRDTRIVEVKFHPSLCRAVNLDGEGDDDGLSLVLQPTNSSGQFVPLPGELLVVAIDPSRDNAQNPVGRWKYAAADVQAKIQTIGSSQGVHLSLRWTGPEPQADRLVVFVYYTLSDGRRVVAEQEIFLNNNHRQHTVWVPRAKTAPGSSQVQTASGQRPAR